MSLPFSWPARVGTGSRRYARQCAVELYSARHLRSRARAFPRRALRRPLLHRASRRRASIAGRSARLRAPKDDHIRYFPTAAAAEAAGFRPAFAAGPKRRPGTPAWLGTSAVVSRALRLIGEGALDEDGRRRAGRSARHDRPPPAAPLPPASRRDAARRRAHAARPFRQEAPRRDGSRLQPGGVRVGLRQRPALQQPDARAPTRERRPSCGGWRGSASSPIRSATASASRTVHPTTGTAVLAFLSARATPGVESVDAVRAIGGRSPSTARTASSTCPRWSPARRSSLEVRFPDPRALLFIVERVRRVFDLGADPAVIGEHLRADPLLRQPLARHPGFACRARGTASSSRCGPSSDSRSRFAPRRRSPGAIAVDVRSRPWRTRRRPIPACFRTRRSSSDAALERAGVMPARAEAIRSLARQVAARAPRLGPCIDGRATIAALSALSGHRRLDRAVYRDAGARRARCVSARRSRPAPSGRRPDRARARPPIGGVAAVARLRGDAALAARVDDARSHPRRASTAT